MIAPKKIQLFTKVVSSTGSATNITKPQFLLSNVNSFGLDSSSTIFNNQLPIMDVDESSDYESVISSSDGAVRKRKRLNNLSQEEKIMRRKLKNREAAQSARDRKKQKMIDLERTIISLESINKELTMENATLKSCTEVLLEENKRLKAQLNLSPSNPTINLEKKPQIIHIKKKIGSNSIIKVQEVQKASNEAFEPTDKEVQCFTTPSVVSEYYDVVTTEDQQINIPNLDSAKKQLKATSTEVKIKQLKSNIPKFQMAKITKETTQTDNGEAIQESRDKALNKSAALDPLQQELSCLLTLKITSLVFNLACNTLIFTLWVLLTMGMSKSTPLVADKMPEVTSKNLPKCHLPHQLRNWIKQRRKKRKWWGPHQKNWNPTAS